MEPRSAAIVMRFHSEIIDAGAHLGLLNARAMRKQPVILAQGLRPILADEPMGAAPCLVDVSLLSNGRSAFHACGVAPGVCSCLRCVQSLRLLHPGGVR
jgi:hypothetical protein